MVYVEWLPQLPVSIVSEKNKRPILVSAVHKRRIFCYIICYIFIITFIENVIMFETSSNSSQSSSLLAKQTSRYFTR